MECPAIPPDAMIFSKNGITTVIDSPVRMEILRIVMEGEQRFDEIVKKLNKAKSTISVHLHDMIDAGILAERADDNDARRKYLYLNADYLGTITQSDKEALSESVSFRPAITSGAKGPASVFRLIFNTIRTSLLKSGVNIEPVLFRAGIDAGEEIAKLVFDSSDEIFLINLRDFFSKNGLGNIVIEKRDPWVITVKNCYECQDLPKIKRPACFFDSGLLTSVFSYKTGKEVLVEETHCYAKGDPFCRFVITKIN